MSAHRGNTRLTLTGRGVGVLVAGLGMSVAGVGFASPALTYIGVITTLAVIVAAVWVTLTGIVVPSRYARVERALRPSRPMVGAAGQVHTTISPTAWNEVTRAMVRGLKVSEQAAEEITGTAHQRARVRRDYSSVTLTYPIAPTDRGQWTLGPCLLGTADALGLTRSRCAIGDLEDVAVWPQVHELTDVARAALGDARHTRAGASTAHPDDASLREYYEGDDLRRVHWASSARRGTMLVRTDEHEGRRPATVLLDLPFDPAGTEWAISAAASIACGVLDSGHEARILGKDLDDPATPTGDARAALLDALVPLNAPERRHANGLRTPIDDALQRARSGAVTFAILEPPAATSLPSLAAIAATGPAWALIRQGRDADGARRAATSLSAAGWHVAVVDHATAVPEAWRSLATQVPA